VCLGAALDPAIHVFAGAMHRREDVDAWVKPGKRVFVGWGVKPSCDKARNVSSIALIPLINFSGVDRFRRVDRGVVPNYGARRSGRFGRDRSMLRSPE
jgi:hypothetical protein